MSRFKRQLIQTVEGPALVTCDNPICKYEIPATPGLIFKDHIRDLAQYLNAPCPVCGQNLLTEKDLADYIRIRRLINWINKYFSWLTWFASEKDVKEARTIRAHVHNGLHLTDEDGNQL